MRDLQVRSSLRTTVLTGLMLGLCTLASAAVHKQSEHKQLAKKIDAILAQPDASRSFWGVEIEDMDSGGVLYSRNADRLFTPASNTKLFTTAAGLALIGPNYQFHTTVESAALPDKYGRISGDLVLVGRGDPNLSGRMLPYNLKTERPFPPTHVLEELADQLVARGVKTVDGDIVADDSFFVYQRYGESWSLGDPVWGWGAPVSALAVNDNEVFVNILPAERSGERAFVSVSPFDDYFQVDNRVLTSPAGTGPRKISIQREPGSNRLVIWGNIPLGDPGAGEALAIEEPAEFCAHLLRDLLAKRGVIVYGHARARHAAVENMDTFTINASAPLGGGTATQPYSPPPVVLAEHVSLPLGLDIQVINKVSQNLHAEMLLRLLGREKGSGGSVAGGLEVLRGFLAQAGLQPQEFLFRDGSGLSRDNLVTPRATVKLLRYAATQPWGAAYIDSLPLAGKDGTLVARFDELPAGATLRAKTGSLEHVNTLSGYLTTSRGEHLAFSILCNNHNLSSQDTNELIDEIIYQTERTPN